MSIKIKIYYFSVRNKFLFIKFINNLIINLIPKEKCYDKLCLSAFNKYMQPMYLTKIINFDFESREKNE
jgi:hypothetical protein